MSASRYIDALAAAAIVLALLLTFFLISAAPLTAEAGEFDDEDLSGDWEDSGACLVTLTGGTAVSSGGVLIDGGDITIAAPGKYVLTGELREGSVTVDSPGEVRLKLSDASISSSGGAAILVREAGKVILTLTGENTVSADGLTGDVDGAIYSRDDLTINGSGSLTIESDCHGVVGNDDLLITGGDITVEAAQDAIHVHDSFRLREASLTLTAGDDAVTVSDGYFYMESGAVTSSSCYEGIEAPRVTITGGVVDLRPTDDGINAPGGGESLIDISGGDVTIINSNGRDADGLDSNGSILISGGNLFISVSSQGGSCAIDVGAETGGSAVISGGTVIAAGGSAMAEGFDASSPQTSVMRAVSGDAGAQVVLTGPEGGTLLEAAIPCPFTSLILSCPEMTSGQDCALTVDGADVPLTGESAPAEFGKGGFGGMGGGRDFRGDNPGNMPDFQSGEPGSMPGFRGDGSGDMPDFRGDNSGTPPEMPQEGVERPSGDMGGGRFMGEFNTDPMDMGGDTDSPGADPEALILVALSAGVLLLALAVGVKIKH